VPISPPFPIDGHAALLCLHLLVVLVSQDSGDLPRQLQAYLCSSCYSEEYVAGVMAVLVHFLMQCLLVSRACASSEEESSDREKLSLLRVSCANVTEAREHGHQVQVNLETY
jgi:hypothetical protein